MKNLKTYLLVLSLFSAAVVSVAGCNGKGSEGQRPGNPYVAPALNETKTVTLAKRSRNSESYQNACLFLNDSFRNMNTCSIEVQSDFDLDSVQVRGQKGEFRRLRSQSTLSEFSLRNSTILGERVSSDSIRTGDLFYLSKSDDYTKYELTLEVLHRDVNSLTIRYQVKSFTLLR